MAGHIHPLDIPSQHYTPIGQIIVGWNLTEALISSIIWKLHKIKDVRRGRALIYGLPAAQKLRVLAVSAKHFTKSSGMDDELKLFAQRAGTLNTQRNLLAHGLWGRMPKERLWKVFKMQELDDELLMIRKEVKPADLDPVRIAQEIRALNSDLKKFMTRNRIPPP